MKICQEGTELFRVVTQTDRQADGQTDMMKLIVAFRNFANSPDNYRWDSESAQKLEAYLSEKRQKKMFPSYPVGDKHVAPFDALNT
jgi:hypothetical protein